MVCYAVLKKWTDDTKSFGSPLLVDFGYEVNDDQFPRSKQGEKMYISAYRHTITLFKEQNATNVFFVHHPDLGSNPDNMELWYPGDKYVDWILASAYDDESHGGTYGVLNNSYTNLISL